MKEVESLPSATQGCAGCDARDARIAELERRLNNLETFNKKCLARVAELESLAAGHRQFQEDLQRALKRIRQLEALLNRNSKNSHKPPSSDPKTRKNPDPPEKPEGEKRKPGGQLEHKGKKPSSPPA